MLDVRYRKFVPYSLPVVLSQYWDWEHIEHVHPDTLGRYRVLESDGDRAVYEQIWPPGWLQRLGLRRESVSVVEQIQHSPREVHFDFVGGRNRGVKVISRLEETEGGCVVDETYRIPYLPNWRWLAHLSLPSIRKRVDQIWDEDIGVDVCHGGWPGVPDSAEDPVGRQPEPGKVEPEAAELWQEVARSEQLAVGTPLRVEIESRSGDVHEVVLVRSESGLFALGDRCPHSGGPLHLGACDGEQIVCPWHGACFSLANGEPVEQPGRESPTSTAVQRYSVRERDGAVEIQRF